LAAAPERYFISVGRISIQYNGSALPKKRDEGYNEGVHYRHALTIVVLLQVRDTAERKTPRKQLKMTECYECHAIIKELHTGGKHARVQCLAVTPLGTAPGESRSENKTVTNMAWRPVDSAQGAV